MSPNKWRPRKVNRKFRQMGNHRITPHPPSQEEDWEKELEEISQCIEKHKQPTYGNFTYT